MPNPSLSTLLQLLQMDQDRIARTSAPPNIQLPRPAPVSTPTPPGNGKTTPLGGTTTTPPSPASDVASIDRQIRMMRLQMQAIPFQLRDPIQVAQAQADANDKIQILEQHKLELGSLASPVPEVGTPLGPENGSTPGGPASAGGPATVSNAGVMADAPAPGSVVNSPVQDAPPGHYGPDSPAPPGVGPGTNNQGATGFAVDPNQSTHAMGMDPNAPTNPAMVAAQDAIGKMADAEAAVAADQAQTGQGPATPSAAAQSSGQVAGVAPAAQPAAEPTAQPAPTTAFGFAGPGFAEVANSPDIGLISDTAGLSGAVAAAAGVANAMSDALGGTSWGGGDGFSGQAGPAEAGISDGPGGGGDPAGDNSGAPSGPSDVSEGSSSW